MPILGASCETLAGLLEVPASSRPLSGDVTELRSPRTARLPPAHAEVTAKLVRVGKKPQTLVMQGQQLTVLRCSQQCPVGEA